MKIRRIAFGSIAPEFRRDNNFVVIPAQSFAENFFRHTVALSRSVQRRRIEKIDAGVQRGSDRCDGLGFGDLSINLRSKSPGAKADFTASQIGATKNAMFHKACSSKSFLIFGTAFSKKTRSICVPSSAEAFRGSSPHTPSSSNVVSRSNGNRVKSTSTGLNNN